MLDIAVFVYCIALMLLQIIIEVKNQRFDFFDLKYIFEVYFIIQLPFSSLITTIFSIGISDARIQYYIDNFTRTKMLICVVLGFTIYIISNIVFSKYYFKLPKPMLKEWNNRKVKLLVFFLFSIGYLSFFLLLKENGGFYTFLENVDSWRNTGLVGQGIYSFPATTLLTIAGLIFFINMRKKTEFKKIKIKIIMLIILSVIPAFFLGFRGYIFSTILEVVVAYNFFYRKISFKKVIPFFFILIICTSLYGIYRECHEISWKTFLYCYQFRPEVFWGIFLRSRGSEIFSKVIEQLSYTHAYQGGYQTIIEALTIWIPHAIWTNKPIAKSVVFSETFFGLNGGISPTILGELYWDFSLLGIILGMFLIGAITALAYNTLTQNRNSKSAILVYCQLYYTSFCMAEAISGTMNGLIIYTIAIIPIIFYLGRNGAIKYTCKED